MNRDTLQEFAWALVIAVWLGGLLAAWFDVLPTP